MATVVGQEQVEVINWDNYLKDVEEKDGEVLNSDWAEKGFEGLVNSDSGKHLFSCLKGDE